MIKGATSYRVFLTALWTTLILGAVMTQEQLSLKQTLIFLTSLTLAFLAQSWLFGTRYFGDAAEVVAGATREEAIYFAGELFEPGEHAANEDQLLDEVLSPYRQIGIRAGFAAVAAPFILAVAWGHVSLSVAGALQILVALLVVPAMSLNHLLLPLAVSVFSVFLQFKTQGFALPVLPLVYLAAFSCTLVFYRFVELEICRTSLATLDDSRLNRRGLWAAGRSAGVLLGLILLMNAVIPDSSGDRSLLSKTAAQLNKVSDRLARKIPERLLLSQSPSKSSPVVRREKSVAKNSGADTGKGQGSDAHGGSESAAGLGTQSPVPGGKLPNLSISKPQNLSGATAGNPSELEDLPPGGRFTENGELPLSRGASSTEAERQQALELAKQLANSPGTAAQPLTEPERQHAVELAKKFAAEPSAPHELTPPTQAHMAELARLAKAESAQAQPMEASKKYSENAGAPGQQPGPGATGVAQSGAQAATPDSGSNDATALPAPPVPHIIDEAPAQVPQPAVAVPPFITEAALRRGMVFLMLLAAVWFAVKLTSKTINKPSSSRSRLSRAKRKEVLAEHAGLNQMRLSPREEIIQRYQFFLKLMALAQFPKEDYLPATDYHQRLLASFPSFARQSEIITSTFCDTFYGEHEVTVQHVKNYRKSLETVLRHFGC